MFGEHRQEHFHYKPSGDVSERQGQGDPPGEAMLARAAHDAEYTVRHVSSFLGHVTESQPVVLQPSGRQVARGAFSKWLQT